MGSDDNPVGDAQVATLHPEVAAAKGGDCHISEHQESDPALAPSQAYLREGRLPSDEKAGRKLVLKSLHYSLLDDVLYQVGEHSTITLVLLADHCHALFLEVHAGKFGVHLRDKKCTVSSVRTTGGWG